MKLISVNQNTPEWHYFRDTHIGASDMAPILGMSPYKTRYELWLEKVGLSTGQIKTPNMQWGNDNESHIRAQMCEILTCDLVPLVFEHETINYLSASTDGIDLDKRIACEIKCTDAEDHRIARDREVPPKYYPQVQQIIEVCELDQLWYCSYHQKDLVYFPVLRDQTFIDIMLGEASEFWDFVQNLKKPQITKEHKEYTKEPFTERNDQQWNNLSLQWKILQTKKRELLAQEEDLKSSLISMTGEKNTVGNGIRISKRMRKGNINYQEISLLKSIDLEIYRKPSSEYWVLEEV